MRQVAAEAGRDAGHEAGCCRGWSLPRLVAAEAGREAGRCRGW